MGRTKAIYSPLSVAATAKQLLAHGLIKSEPVWYQPVLNTPPMTDFARKPAQEHHRRGLHKTTDIREIQQIQTGLLPKLRKKFYKQHPWELARPKILVEEDGADYSRQDWSKMEQVGKALDGERYSPQWFGGLTIVWYSEHYI
jgi:small subunit ribosomal protein S23